MIIKRRKDKTLIFNDYPEFRPNLTPREMFLEGIFGGTYWRPIYSSINNKKYENYHKKFPKSWWKDISENKLTSSIFDVSINKYKVKSGTSLEYWENKKWIKPIDPYGWVCWYCEFCNGRRCEDDKRQINRWLGIAGPNGRFKKRLINLISHYAGSRTTAKNTTFNDYNISPVIRQLLLQWGFELKF
jgi:hypothetical protein